jgi:DNA-binding response OmpR family regulator
MAELLILSNAPDSEALPALALLQHRTITLPAEVSALLDAPESECIILDARRDLPASKNLSHLLGTTGLTAPLLVVLTEGGLAAISHEWGADGFILDTAGPAEVDARIRLLIEARRQSLIGADPESGEIRSGEVVIDEATYSAKIRGVALDLTFKEFELLKYLA